MTTLQRSSYRLDVGTRVRSVTVGSREEFEGVITERLRSGAYHVVDENGDGWHRERNELIVRVAS